MPTLLSNSVAFWRSRRSDLFSLFCGGGVGMIGVESRH